MPESNAWIIKLTDKETVAIGENELLHIITEPELYKIPKTKKYCQHVIKWQSHVLPVMNITGLLYNQDIGISNIIGIVAYRERSSDQINYGAIDLAAIPKKTLVYDEEACDLSEATKQWKPLTTACFKKEDRAIPIISLEKIFTEKMIHVY